MNPSELARINKSCCFHTVEYSIATNRDTVQLYAMTAVVDGCLTKTHKNIIWVILHTHTHTIYADTSQGSSTVSTRRDEMALLEFLNLGANHTGIFSF